MVIFLALIGLAVILLVLARSFVKLGKFIENIGDGLAMMTSNMRRPNKHGIPDASALKKQIDAVRLSGKTSEKKPDEYWKNVNNDVDRIMDKIDWR